MKKIVFSIVTFLFLIIPINALAYEEGITSYYIDATVLDNGDVNVKELIVLNGSFNGFERIINSKNSRLSTFDGSITSFRGSDIYNANGIELISIKDIPITNTTNFNSIFENGEEFSKVSSASKGDYGKYIVTPKSNGYSYLIYNPSKGKERGFYIEYVINNYGVVHEDVSEIYMNLFDELTEYINNLEMYVHISNNKNLLRAWAHGPLTGEVSIIDNQTIKVTASNINPNTAIDVRLAFDKSILNKSNKLSNVKALDKIIEVETERADIANKEREEALQTLLSEAKYYVELAENTPNRDNYNQAVVAVNYLPNSEVKTELQKRLEVVYERVLEYEKNVRTVTTIIFSVWLLGLMLIIYNYYKKYDKEYIASFRGDYYRDFPANYGPEIVSYLINKKIDNKDLSACLMNLIYKKAVTYEKTYYGKKNKETYFLTPNVEGKELTNQEQNLINFLLEGKATTLEEIKKKAKSDYNSFIKGFSTWKQVTIDAGTKEQFYETHAGKKTLCILYCILGTFLAFFLGFDEYCSYFILSTLVFLSSIVGIIYLAFSKKRTVKGNEDYRRWMGLKKFLQDFSNMDKRELPEVTLWEKYLVYALPLGCAKKLAKDMEIRIKEIDPNSTVLTDFDYMQRTIMINNIINNAVASSITSAYAEKSRQEMSNVAGSSSSSGGGFGGGFSSGGGFGGGGGGGGRF